MTKIKFCGITREEDAREAIRLGANALGFNFYEKSSRFLPSEQAQGITRLLPTSVWRVGVFVNSPREEVERIAREAALTHLQFHGDETSDFCRLFRSWEVIRAIRVRREDVHEQIANFTSAADYLLFDHFDPDEFGGTGKSLEDDLLLSLQKTGIFDRSFLAGGLTSATVGRIVKHLSPFGVDVASGIESSPGRKDRQKMEDFVRKVRANEESTPVTS